MRFERHWEMRNDWPECNVRHITANESVERISSRLYNHDFGEIDEKMALSIDDKQAIEKVQKFLSLVDGHFVVGLPWIIDNPGFQVNQRYGMKRLTALKRKFTPDPEMFGNYEEVISQHLEKGYAVLLNMHINRPTDGSSWYLPHHMVMNPHKCGNVRVVFGDAARSNGVSLTDHIHQGPNVVQNLVQVLIRFRIGTFALSSDIKEMFIQVRMPEMDRNYLCFLRWQDSYNNGPIKEFSLSVHPFGARTSPFCANSALRQCAHLYEGSDSDLVCCTTSLFLCGRFVGLDG